MNIEQRNNYYEVLEVSSTASQHDILIAYEKAKRTYSPQNSSLYAIFSEEEATALRSLIEEAYAVLGNQTYRNIYERRVQAKTYTDNELTLNAIKKASENLYDQKTAQAGNNPAALAKQEPAFEKNTEFESEISSQSDWTGNFLQKIREYRKVSIDSMHETTKVNPWYIKALENMDPHNLPAPVFVRGYVIQIAKSLGLDEKAVAESYMKIYKQKLEQKK